MCLHENLSVVIVGAYVHPLPCCTPCTGERRRGEETGDLCTQTGGGDHGVQVGAHEEDPESLGRLGQVCLSTDGEGEGSATCRLLLRPCHEGDQHKTGFFLFSGGKFGTNTDRQ